MLDDSAGFSLLPLDRLRQQRSKKWSTYPPDVLPAWIAEMDFPLAPVIRDELLRALQQAETGYIPAREVERLQVACTHWLQREYGLEVRPNSVQLVPDITRGMELAISLISPPDRPVILITPAYPSFFEIVRLSRRPVLEVPLRTIGSRPALDLAGIKDALRHGGRTVVLCNPHNPVGRAFRAEELRDLSVLVEAFGARVITDEVHAPFVYPPLVHVPYAGVSEVARNHSVTLISAAKGWNIAGLKCAEIILTKRDDLTRWLGQPAEWARGAGILGILASTVAFDEGAEWLSAVRGYLAENRLLLGELIAQTIPAVQYSPPEATYFAWLDCRSMGLADPAAYYLERGRVALSSGQAYGAPGVGHVRLNFATSREILAGIVQRMATGSL
jgi:cystathionine beta-lyase